MWKFFLLHTHCLLNIRKHTKNKNVDKSIMTQNVLNFWEFLTENDPVKIFWNVPFAMVHTLKKLFGKYLCFYKIELPKFSLWSKSTANHKLILSGLFLGLSLNLTLSKQDFSLATIKQKKMCIIRLDRLKLASASCCCAGWLCCLEHSPPPSPSGKLLLVTQAQPNVTS